MSGLFCKSAGIARMCGTCKHNPTNQPGKAMGNPITPKAKPGGACPHYSEVVKPLVSR